MFDTSKSTVVNLIIFTAGAGSYNVINCSFGPVAGADAKCQAFADAAALGGTYRAWVSTSASSASTRFSHPTEDYVLTDGTVVANGWSDLINGLDNRVNKDEYGATRNSYTWTATNLSGSHNSANGGGCNSWTCSGWSCSGGEGGRSTCTNMYWTRYIGGGICIQNYRLYCFEQ